VRSERRVGVELAEEVDAGPLQAPGLHGSTRGFLRRSYWGQEGRGTTGGEESRWRSKLPVATLGEIPAVAWAGVAGEGFGELPGIEAELLRALARSGAQQGGRSTVGQGALRGGASGRWR
jgi:hypothetical protein